MNRHQAIQDSGSAELGKLLSDLEALKNQLEAAMRASHKRSLPFNELLFDRWERAVKLGFGEGASVYDTCCLFGDVKVGKFTWIGPFTVLDGSGGLTIGDFCSISAGVQVYTHDSVAWAVSGGKEAYAYAPTVIGNNCYIGPNTIIAKGVEIGDGTIVGANSFVNRSFPAHSKIAGSPAKEIQ